MRGPRRRASVVLLVVLCTGCPWRKTSPPQQAQAPPLQTGNGTLTSKKTTQPQEKASSPLASPLPPPSAQSVPIPPPAPKKVRHRTKKPVETKQADAPAPAAGTQTTTATSTAQGVPVQASAETASPIGQLTTGDSASGERTKHETADLIGSTQHGLNGIKRSLSTEEKVTAAQIRTFLQEAEQALATGDTDGGHTLATKAKLLLDELTKP